GHAQGMLLHPVIARGSRFVFRCCPLTRTESREANFVISDPDGDTWPASPSYPLQRGVFLHNLLPPVARKADGQSCVLALTLALDHRAQAEFWVAHLRA